MRMEFSFRKIAIVGSGAVGCYYGALLARAHKNTEVDFLMRSDRAAVRTRGLRVKTPQEEFFLGDVRAVATAAEIGPVDLVIVALKTTANAELPVLLAPLLHAGTAILTLQNGLGSDEELARLFGAERVLGGLCFVCVYRTAPGEISCTKPGHVSFGEFGRPIGERLRAVEKMFSAAGVRCQLDDDLAKLRWKKLVWNVPFNGLAIAAGGITTEQILAEPGLENEARALMEEIATVAGRLGFLIPASFIERQIEQTRPMGPYKPSSLIDWEAGRAVEVEAIWGEPLRRARAVGAAAPKLALLYALLQRVTVK
jgi:2-dehydropantoate 2-reductase